VLYCIVFDFFVKRKNYRAKKINKIIINKKEKTEKNILNVKSFLITKDKGISRSLPALSAPFL